MGWSIGYDSRWNRDIGYGVPSLCDEPGCQAVINRGLAYVCGAEPYGGDDGCGLFFCSEHLGLNNDDRQPVCGACAKGDDWREAKPDLVEWIIHKLTDDSWAEWRKQHYSERPQGYCRTCSTPRPQPSCFKCDSDLEPIEIEVSQPALPDIEIISSCAREVGYAVAVHGSRQRDLDIMAAAWVENAVSPPELAQHLAQRLDARVLADQTQDKPFGRWSCVLQIDGWFKPIDLSVTGNVWRPIETAPKDGTAVLLNHKTHGTIQGWFSKGEWSDDTPISPREYSGDVWVLGDDIKQEEVEFGPDGWEHHGNVIGWMPLWDKWP